VTATVDIGDEHPNVFVTTKLYVPDKLTEGVAVALPETIPGPVHEYVPPPEPERETAVNVQFNVALAPAIAAGIGLTVMVLVAVFVHEFMPVAVSVYIIFPDAVGVALTVEPVVANKPPEAPADQVYVLAPLPVKVKELPKHNEFVEAIVNVGTEFTTI
jgi:hypothetical protein